MSLSASGSMHGGQPVQPQDPAIPRLAEPFEPTPSSKGSTTPRATDDDQGKKKKRSIFGFGKKKDSEKTTPSGPSTSKTEHPVPIAVLPPITRGRPPTTSPRIQPDGSHMFPSSPGRTALSSSPRVSSPAGSQIFERDVQESNMPAMPNSPAIPSHITTENHIPPVLDASSTAITDDHLDPDNVEIITASGHQPAALTVTGTAPYDSMSGSWDEELGKFADKDDNASNYGSFDNTDVRRLSFISFADVVQAEQGSYQPHTGSRDSMHLAGLTSLASVGLNRSPSPIRSPVSSQGPGTSPPTSKSGSMKGVELSPTRKPLGSPISTHHPMGSGNGEINIETMTQALRRTGSTDLSGFRSTPHSPIEGPSR